MKEEQVVNLLPNLCYSSQDTLIPSPEGNGFPDRSSALSWRDRCCGVICVQIVLRSLGLDAPALSELIRIGVERGRYVTDIGWSHKGLADFLIEHGMEARALAMDSRLPLDLMLADGWLAILSVRPLLLAQAIPSARDRIGGHLVLCHGFSKDQSGRLVAYLISDPDYDPAMRRIGSLVAAETVLDSWAHRAIVIKPPRSRLSQGAYDD